MVLGFSGLGLGEMVLGFRFSGKVFRCKPSNFHYFLELEPFP